MTRARISHRPPAVTRTPRPIPPAAAAPTRPLLKAQRAFGNQAVLRVSRQSDASEREATRMAEAASRGPGDRAAGAAARHRDASSRVVSNSTQLEFESSRPLPIGVRSTFEPRFGRDLSGVHVHDGAADRAAAMSVSARAFTLGGHIWLGPGERADDMRLMAHELAHVVQQRDSPQQYGNQIQRQPATDRPAGDVLQLDEDTVPMSLDPSTSLNYVERVVKGVGIFGWGGPFRLDRTVENGVGVDAEMLLLQRSDVSLDGDPLAATGGPLLKLYKTKTAAFAAVQAFGVPGLYTYYLGPGGYIYPTVISDTTAPALCAALRKAVEQERVNARAAETLSINLAFWYAGARFPIKAGEPVSPAAVPRAAAAGGGEAFVVVEIGAGDLKAAIQLAKKGGVKVIAVEPAGAAAEAIAEFEQAGGTFVKGTADALEAGSAHQVFQYFPWRIGGTGSAAWGGTWRLISDTMRLLKPGGAAHFVTEDLATAEFLAKEASTNGLRAVITETTAGAAAPGAAGAGVPSFSSSLKVWLVNIYT